MTTSITDLGEEDREKDDDAENLLVNMPLALLLLLLFAVLEIVGTGRE